MQSQSLRPLQNPFRTDPRTLQKPRRSQQPRVCKNRRTTLGTPPETLWLIPLPTRKNPAALKNPAAR